MLPSPAVALATETSPLPEVTETPPLGALSVPNAALETPARLTVTSPALVPEDDMLTVVVWPLTPVRLPAPADPAFAPKVAEPPAEATATV